MCDTAVYSLPSTQKLLPLYGILVLYVIILKYKTGGGICKFITGKYQDSVLSYNEEKEYLLKAQHM
jgi:hypothetical protein